MEKVLIQTVLNMLAQKYRKVRYTLTQKKAVKGYVCQLTLLGNFSVTKRNSYRSKPTYFIFNLCLKTCQGVSGLALPYPKISLVKKLLKFLSLSLMHLSGKLECLSLESVFRLV
jgi:hypothetical protein